LEPEQESPLCKKSGRISTHPASRIAIKEIELFPLRRNFFDYRHFSLKNEGGKSKPRSFHNYPNHVDFVYNDDTGF
jgi:hypothetical protein